MIRYFIRTFYMNKISEVMKRMIFEKTNKTWLLTLVIALCYAVNAWGDPNANLTDKCYEIANQSDFEWLRNNYNSKSLQFNTFKLVSNVSLDSWTGIGTKDIPFSGVFDGNGYTITINSMKVKDGTYGLFNYINGASISNVILRGTISISGNCVIGSLVGDSKESNITNVTTYVSVNCKQPSKDSMIGGLVGHMSGGSITKCIYNKDVQSVNSGTIVVALSSKDLSIGGICASADCGAISYCYFLGSISVVQNGNPNINIGGILGEAETSENSIELNYNYSDGIYTYKNNGKAQIGAVAGDVTQGNVVAEGNFYTAPSGVSGIGSGESSVEGSIGTVIDSTGKDITISTADEFNFFAIRVNNGKIINSVTLQNDIDFSSTNIIPVGTSEQKFSGVFDGQHYAIKNVNINNSDPVAGLFAYVNGATIKNLEVTGNIKVNGGVNDTYCGIIANSAGSSVFSQIISDLNIEASSQQGKKCYIGGVVAYSEGEVSVLTSLSKGKLTGTSEWGQNAFVGGFVGYGNNNISVKNSFVENKFVSASEWYAKCSPIVPVDANIDCSNNYLYDIDNVFNNDSKTTEITESDIKSGVLCSKLNIGLSTPVWGQVLGNDIDGEYLYPRPEGKNVVVKDNDGNYHAGLIKLSMGGSDLCCPEYKSVVGDKMQLSITLPDTYWHAIYVPVRLTYESWKDKFEVAKIMNFHDYDVDGVNYVVLEVQKIDKGTLKDNHPYIIRAKEASAEPQILLLNSTDFSDDQCRTLYNINEGNTISCATTETEYTFHGTYSQKDNLTSSDYVLTNGYLNNGAMQSGSKAVYPCGWYMSETSRTSDSGNANNAARRIAIRFSGFDENEVANELAELALGLESTTIESVRVHPISFYNNKGVKINAPLTGLNIVKMSDGTVKKIWVK